MAGPLFAASQALSHQRRCRTGAPSAGRLARPGAREASGRVRQLAGGQVRRSHGLRRQLDPDQQGAVRPDRRRPRGRDRRAPRHDAVRVQRGDLDEVREDLRRQHVDRRQGRAPESVDEPLCGAAGRVLEAGRAASGGLQPDDARVRADHRAADRRVAGCGAERADGQRDRQRPVRPGGIVAVTRAQERGYALVSIG